MSRRDTFGSLLFAFHFHSAQKHNQKSEAKFTSSSQRRRRKNNSSLFLLIRISSGNRPAAAAGPIQVQPEQKRMCGYMPPLEEVYHCLPKRYSLLCRAVMGQSERSGGKQSIDQTAHLTWFSVWCVNCTGNTALERPEWREPLFSGSSIDGYSRLVGKQTRVGWFC